MRGQHLALDGASKRVQRKAIGLEPERVFELVTQCVETKEGIGHQQHRQERPPVERARQCEGQHHAKDQRRALQQKRIGEGNRGRRDALTSTLHLREAVHLTFENGIMDRGDHAIVHERQKPLTHLVQDGIGGIGAGRGLADIDPQLDRLGFIDAA